MIEEKIELSRHLVFITDDNYVMPTCVAINSFSINLNDDNIYKYIVHICTFGLTERNLKHLETLSSNKISVIIHTISNLKYHEIFSSISQSTHVTPTALIKFDLSTIFSDIDEILYLDSDLIVNKSLSTLFDYDISNYYLAASFELWKYLNVLYDFSSQRSIPNFYFNSGVMLLNLKKMREDAIPEKLWKEKINSFNSDKIKDKMMDQDALNSICSHQCLHLPIKFNCNSFFTSGINIENVNKIYNTTYSSCSDLKDDAVIIHYVGKSDKPWNYLQGNCVKEWEYYYIASGYDLSMLSRKSYTSGFMYKISRFCESLKIRGIINTFKYIFFRRTVK